MKILLAILLALITLSCSEQKEQYNNSNGKLNKTIVNKKLYSVPRDINELDTFLKNNDTVESSAVNKIFNIDTLYRKINWDEFFVTQDDSLGIGNYKQEYRSLWFRVLHKKKLLDTNNYAFTIYFKGKNDIHYLSVLDEFNHEKILYYHKNDTILDLLFGNGNYDK